MSGTDTTKKKDETVYFTMDAPDWYIDLEYNEKIRLAKAMTHIPDNPKFLSDDEISKLMPSSVK